MRHEGKHPYNAEVIIDYISKDVSFNYTQDINRKNTWKAYADNSIFGIVGMFIGLCVFSFFSPFLGAGILIMSHKGANPYFLFIFALVLYFNLLFYSFYLGIKAMDGVSIICHENIPWLRKMYPKTNAIFHILFKKIKKKLNIKKEIDFKDIPNEENFIRKTHMVIGNKLIMNYNIALAEYDLIGDCSKYIKKIEKKCIEENEKKRKNPAVTKFKIVFEFSQRPINGKVVIL